MDHEQKHGIVRRAGVGVAKAWAYSLGITSLYREGRRIAGSLGALGAGMRRKLSDGPENYRHETFEAAVQRLGLDGDELVRQARIFNLRAASWFAAMMLATSWMAYIPWSDAPLQHFVLCLGLVLMTGAKFITWRFRFCQIRDQELYSFMPWILNLGRW